MMPDSLSTLAAMDLSQAHRRNGRAEQPPPKVHIYRSPQHRVSQLMVTETSADGTVRVSVDAHGLPTELILTDRARGVGPARLSAELMSCLQQARSKLAGRVSQPQTSSVTSDDDPSLPALLC